MSASRDPGGLARRAALFDLDGTLLDSVEHIVACFEHTMTVHRGRPPGRDFWMARLGAPLRAHLADAGAGADLDAMVATYRQHDREHHDARVRAFPDVADGLRALRDGGARLGLVTSKGRDAATRGVRVAGLDGLFDVFVCAEDVLRHKPDPMPILHALERLGVAPEDAVYVGDAPADVLAARAAGVRALAVRWTAFPVDVVEAAGPDGWVDDVALTLVPLASHDVRRA